MSYENMMINSISGLPLKLNLFCTSILEGFVGKTNK